MFQQTPFPSYRLDWRVRLKIEFDESQPSIWRRGDEELAEESKHWLERNGVLGNKTVGVLLARNRKKYDRHYHETTKLWSLDFFLKRTAALHSLDPQLLLDIRSFRAYYRLAPSTDRRHVFPVVATRFSTLSFLFLAGR